MDYKKYLRGTGTLTHAGISISAGANFTLKLEPVVDAAPDTEQNRDPLGFVIKRRGMSIECDNFDITPDMVRMLTGYNNANSVTPGAHRIDFDEAQTDLLEGETVLVGALVDQTPITIQFKRGVAVPPGQSIVVSGKEYGGSKLTFVKCHPTDGTQISGYWQIGNLPA